MAKRQRGMSFYPRMVEEGERRYAMPRKYRQYTLANQKTVRTDLGLRYHLFGKNNTQRIQYRVDAERRNVDTGEQQTQITYFDEYFTSLNRNYGIRIRIMAENEKGLEYLSKPVLDWINSLSPN